MGNKQALQRKPSAGSGLGRSKYQSPETFQSGAGGGGGGGEAGMSDHHLFSKEELKSVRLVALQGPFVDAKTGEPLREFYAKFCPGVDMEDKIDNIVESGMEVRMLYEKLREKYGRDLSNFRNDD